MANVLVQDGAGVAKYLKATGDGSNGDPFVVQHLMGSGATDDAAVAGELYPLAGIYQATVDEVDSDDIGRVRMSDRRAIMTVHDHKFVVLTKTTPTPSDSDITADGSTAIASGDLEIRDTVAHTFMIRMFPWQSLSLNFNCNFDQACVLSLHSVINNDTEYATLASFTIPAATRRFSVFSVETAAAEGAIIGGSTVAANALYAVPAMAHALRVILKLKCAVAPTSGEATIYITRRG